MWARFSISSAFFLLLITSLSTNASTHVIIEQTLSNQTITYQKSEQNHELYQGTERTLTLERSMTSAGSRPFQPRSFKKTIQQLFGREKKEYSHLRLVLDQEQRPQAEFELQYDDFVDRYPVQYVLKYFIPIEFKVGNWEAYKSGQSFSAYATPEGDEIYLKNVSSAIKETLTQCLHLLTPPLPFFPQRSITTPISAFASTESDPNLVWDFTSYFYGSQLVEAEKNMLFEGEKEALTLKTSPIKTRLEVTYE